MRGRRGATARRTAGAARWRRVRGGARLVGARARCRGVFDAAGGSARGSVDAIYSAARARWGARVWARLGVAVFAEWRAIGLYLAVRQREAAAAPWRQTSANCSLRTAYPTAAAPMDVPIRRPSELCASRSAPADGYWRRVPDLFFFAPVSTAVCGTNGTRRVQRRQQ
ncbi:hypothetical protein FGB62_40g157 [Gracilaria domingensis]|nr:hypothetical protein FGB62_40g157 [Gracilaria domingensis]